MRLKTVQQAWQELEKRGPTLFDAEGPPTGPEYGVITISEVGLGYRECCFGSANVQEQLQPYYVFGGQAELPNTGQQVKVAAYVPAWR